MSRHENVRLTREQLYELVWSKPMTEIAADFGMSSVAFAKYCKAADVPRPARGYWQQLASGMKLKPTRLPKPDPKTLLTIVISKYARPPLARRKPPPDLPHVEIPERIGKIHPVAKELDDRLKPDFKHQQMPTVRGFSEAVLKVGESTRRRALRLLHLLFKSVEERGHAVRLRKSADTSEWQRGRCALEFVVDGEAIGLSFHEHLTRKPHEKTEREKRWSVFERSYDLEPSGRLILDLRVPWPTDTRTTWRDTEKGTLESLLPEIVWAVDEAGRALATHRSRLAEQARQAEAARKIAEEREKERLRLEAEEKRRRDELEARAAYKRGLERDLRVMTRRWSSAQAIRSFLAAVEDAIPVVDRGEGARRWLAWAFEYAERLDPLNEPHKIPKDLEPELSQLRATQKAQ
jgi:hypothetical protein